MFASIDANEIANFEILLKETFPRFTVISIPVVNNMKGRNDRAYISTCHKYLVLVARDNFVSSGLRVQNQSLVDSNRSQAKCFAKSGNRKSLTRDWPKRAPFSARQFNPFYAHTENIAG